MTIKPHYDEFVLYFPTSMYVTERYSSWQEVRSTIEAESEEAAFDASLYHQYKCTLIPRKESILKIHYKCKHCDAVISFHRNSVL